MKKGKLIVIDGLDGSGKQTQVEMLRDYYISEGLVLNKDFAIIDFPRHGMKSGQLVDEYLAGAFGKDPNKMNPYIVAMMYMVDRAISFATEPWGEVYRNGGIVIADRYISSTVIYQYASSDYAKLNSAYSIATNDDFMHFVNFIYNTEVYKNNIPAPDLVIYLKTSKKANEAMLKNRRDTDISHFTDINESNRTYLDIVSKVLDAYEIHINEYNYDELVYFIHHEFLNIIDENNNIRSREDIHKEILSRVSNFI